jgi:hypothetical protein
MVKKESKKDNAPERKYFHNNLITPAQGSQ